MPRLRDQWTVSLLKNSSGSYEELMPLANALGVTHLGGSSLSVRINKTDLKIWLSINSGTVVGIVIETALESSSFSGELFMKLRTEEHSDVVDKARGISQEVQIGEPQFDKAVYIDSNAADGEVRRLLGSLEVRQAVRFLLDAGADEVKVTTKTAQSTLRLKGQPITTDTLLGALEAYVTLSRVGGPQGAVQERRGEGLQILALGSAPLGIAMLYFANDSWGVGFWQTGFAFLGSAAVSLLVARPLIERAVAGDSGSGARARLIQFFTFLFGGFAGASLMLMINAVSLTGHQSVRQGRIVSVENADTDDDSYRALIEWDGGGTQRHSFSRLPAVGQRVRHVTNEGRWFTWGEKYAVR